MRAHRRSGGAHLPAAVPPLLDAWSRNPDVRQVDADGFGDTSLALRLRDFGELRLADMDNQGIDVQVLSPASPGVQNLLLGDAVPVARDVNDALAGSNPERFQGWATIPTPDPAAAATELERAVTQLGRRGAMLYGRTRDAGGRTGVRRSLRHRRADRCSTASPPANPGERGHRRDVRGHADPRRGRRR